MDVDDDQLALVSMLLFTRARLPTTKSEVSLGKKIDFSPH